MSPLLAFALAVSTLSPVPVGPGECVVFAPLGGQETVVGGDECSRRTLPEPPVTTVYQAPSRPAPPVRPNRTRFGRMRCGGRRRAPFKPAQD